MLLHSSSALGFAEASQSPTTLVIGDVSALHDIGSLHSLANDATVLKQTPGKKSHPLTTIVVNNNGGFAVHLDFIYRPFLSFLPPRLALIFFLAFFIISGGGIFSFLPVARYGNDVSFDEFYGTPTNSFSFGNGAEAFNVPFRRAVDRSSFYQAFKEAREQGQHSIVEAVVAGRQKNVATHRRITDSVNQFVTNFLDSSSSLRPSLPRLSVKSYQNANAQTGLSTSEKTLVLLHGWMGDKSEWDLVGASLSRNLPHDWNIITVDLPGHGFSPRLKSSDGEALLGALHLTAHADDKYLSVDGLAEAVLSSLSKHHNIDQIDAIAGYSLGGRVATAMLRRMESTDNNELPQVILVSTDPGRGEGNAAENPVGNPARIEKDDDLAARIISHANKAILLRHTDEGMLLWGDFLESWYSAPIWGSLSESPGYRDLRAKRCRALQRNGRDLAAILSQSSPPRNQLSFSSLNHVHPNTLLLAGGLDSKYAAIGRMWETNFGITYKELEGVGHALLVESAASVADEMSYFLQAESLINAESINSEDVVTAFDRLEDDQQSESLVSKPEPEAPVDDDNSAGSSLGLRFETFSIELSDGNPRRDSVSGIGWDVAAKASKTLKRRSGVILQIESSSGAVGVGEVSPLAGLHAETLEEAIQQLVVVQVKMWESSGVDFLSEFEASEALKLNGYLTQYLEQLVDLCGIIKVLPSVRSGLEMALLGLAAQKVGQPIHQALAHGQGCSQVMNLPINGLIMRGMSPGRPLRDIVKDSPSFSSFKVKVGHQTSEEDAASISQAFQRFDVSQRRGGGMLRADANQAWNESEAIAFVSSLDGLEVHAVDRLEFIEEPLKKHVSSSTGSWTLASQVDALERFHMHTGIPYAIDESLAALALQHDFDFPAMEKELEETFTTGPRRCAAFILKPALLGFELSWQLARLARHKFGIGAVFSSSFDSGVGLAYTAFFGALSNAIVSQGRTYPHGIGTFTFFNGDTLTPPFASYVNKIGDLNIASISRAVYGLTLDEMHSYFVSEESTKEIDEWQTRGEDEGLNDDDVYETSSASVSSRAGISVALSINLPFSAAVAHSRFTDLPQIPKWAPWVSSVAYQGKETEWRLNVRGVPLKWRATSQLLEGPCPGIQWESVSGLINSGVAEFIPDTADSCVMKVKMSFVTPRIFSPVFQGVSVFLEEFVREKLLRWSLESFRDVVKADLAVERGDLELGDALFSAAEGKANAIEATLNSGPTSVKNNVDPRWR
jgi:o-succinylbenzoate synthase